MMIRGSSGKVTRGSVGLSQLQSDLDSGLLFCGLGTGPHTCGLEAGLALDGDLFEGKNCDLLISVFVLLKSVPGI